MLNTFSQSLVIWEPTTETSAQEMNEGPGNKLGAQRAEQFPHLGNYTLIPGISQLATFTATIADAVFVVAAAAAWAIIAFLSTHKRTWICSLFSLSLSASARADSCPCLMSQSAYISLRHLKQNNILHITSKRTCVVVDVNFLKLLFSLRFCTHVAMWKYEILLPVQYFILVSAIINSSCIWSFTFYF